MKQLRYAAALAITLSGLALADNKCQNFRGVLQGRLEAPAGWMGDVYGALDETSVMTAAVRGTILPVTSADSGVGLEQGWQLLWDFGAEGTITTEIPYGLVLKPAPGPQGYGDYRGVGKIVGATGRFDKSSGTVLVEGPYVVWFLTPGDRSTVQGKWNATVTFRICKAE